MSLQAAYMTPACKVAPQLGNPSTNLTLFHCLTDHKPLGKLITIIIWSKNKFEKYISKNNALN